MGSCFDCVAPTFRFSLDMLKLRTREFCILVSYFWAMTIFSLTGFSVGGIIGAILSPVAVLFTITRIRGDYSKSFTDCFSVWRKPFHLIGCFFMTGLISLVSIGLLSPWTTVAFLRIIENPDAGYFESIGDAFSRTTRISFWFSFVCGAVCVALCGLGLFTSLFALVFKCIVYTMVFPTESPLGMSSAPLITPDAQA